MVGANIAARDGIPWDLTALAEPKEYAVQYWYNISTGKVETDEDRGQDADVLGPYDSAAEAAKALEIARAKTEAWDEQDREWDQRGAAADWSDEDLED